jgi:phage gpG-like protein
VTSFELESMAGVFLGSLEFRWGRQRSPRVVANKIDKLDAGIRDMLFPMVATRQILMDDINDRFEREVDPDGIPWKKHNDEYTRYLEIKGYPGTILRKDHALIDWLNEPTTFPIRGNDLFVDTENAPPYWRIHDRGGVAGRGVTMPKRSYLGMSEAAAFNTIDVFDEWIGGLLQIVIGPATGVAMERGELGRIKTRIGMGRPAGRILPIGFGANSVSGARFGLTDTGVE